MQASFLNKSRISIRGFKRIRVLLIAEMLFSLVGDTDPLTWKTQLAPLRRKANMIGGCECTCVVGLEGEWFSGSNKKSFPRVSRFFFCTLKYTHTDTQTHMKDTTDTT